MSGKTTAISYINKKGGLKSNACNKIGKKIWIWCTSSDLNISAAQIQGKDNFEANKNSRKFQQATEWQLNPKIYKAVCDTLGTLEIDLFASWINRQTEKYVSWKPEAFAVDAFSINGKHHFMYIFPPFSLLTNIIKKVCWDQATAILVFPAWSTQPSANVPLKIRPNLTNLILPQIQYCCSSLSKKN